MKKAIAMIAMIVGFAMVSYGQVYQSTLMVSAADDTLTNTDTAYLYTPGLSAEYDITVSLTQTKISGTVAGTAILQGSVTNSPSGNWVTLKSNPGTAISGSYVDTSTALSNATASYHWTLPKASATYPYYRVRVVTTGTQVSKPTGILYSYYRKP